MHYYQFNIGDYASHTRHLSPIEDIAYRRLLDLYYLHERPLNVGLTSVARQINMREYEVEVKAVLDEFWTLTDEGWINRRADREIEHFQGKRQQASNAGKASAERRRNARSTDVQPTNNQEPVTNNQKPDKPKKGVFVLPDWIPEEVWDNWISFRRTKGGITEHAKNLCISNLEKLRKQGHDPVAVINQSIMQGWAGLFPLRPDAQAESSNAVPNWAPKRARSA